MELANEFDAKELVNYSGPDVLVGQTTPELPMENVYEIPVSNDGNELGRRRFKLRYVMISIAIASCLALAIAGIIIAHSNNVKDTFVSELEGKIETLRELLEEQKGRLKLTTEQLKATTEQLNATLLQLDESVKEVKERRDITDGPNNMGDIYTRWGRTVCGDNSTLIYKGIASGGDHAHSGGGVNYQCLPEVPEYNRYYVGGGWSGATVHGVEYESGSYGIFPNSANNQNVPCAKCYTNHRPAVMMIPAKRTCPDGWAKEYEGYLMTNHWSYAHATTFECVDANPEYLEGLADNTDGALFFFTRTICNGIPCPPYFNNRELTCVMCSK